ncbi:MAG: DUF4270 family protein [Bacteroidota bacterium]|nr:DUF4270 family protein [Bacteroidota bacterium]MDP3145029.1 DUF4270 family protein [Bacteroidota bacterium]
MKIIKNTGLLFIFLLALTACKKDHSILGVDVQPEIDAINATHCDTAIISGYTLGYDSIPSYNDNLKFLGSNQDPTFGRTDVGLYLNANIPNGITSTTFGDDANLVSAEIVLVVNTLNFVGDQSTALTYSVFALDSALNTSRLYYSDNTKLHNKNLILATHTTSYSALDGKLVLRIPIDFNYAKSILNNPQYLVDNGTFLSYYKGFYITAAGSNLNPVSAQGVITKFNLEDVTSGFYLHYQHGTPSATKQDIDYKFNFSGTNAVRFNTIKYQSNQGGNYILNQQLQGNTILGQQNLFLKGIGGTKINLQIPFLDHLKNYSDSFPIAINRAEFVFNVDPSFASIVGNGYYFTPPKLALLPLDSLGKEAYAVDQLNSTDFGRYGGTFDEANNRYVFNIARHVQAILNKQRKNYGFRLVVADPAGSIVVRRDNYAERVVLVGSNNANTALRPKFNLSFIKYKHN